MKILAVALILLTTPVLAGGPAWEDMVASPEPGPQIMGAIFACANAATDPLSVSSGLLDAGWAVVDAEDGNFAFQSQHVGLMFWQAPGFCRLDTDQINTDGMSTFLNSFGLIQTGTDADGCAQFMLPDTSVIATLTSGGNDPSCASVNGSALQFEIPQ